MEDKSALINQLRIDRPAEIESDRRWPMWAAVVAVVIVLAGAAVWWLLPRGIPVGVVTATTAPADTAIGPGTILDASGYVVARRQATVSSKVTGKVVQVSIEEGQRVERDEVIGRLDDTNARAAVEQARAQRAQADASLVAARVALDNAVPTFRRNEQQLAKAVISAQTFDTAKAAYDTARTSVDVAQRTVEVASANLVYAERNLEDTVVRAPFTGIVTVKNAQPGEMVSPVSAGGGFTRTGIGTIVDMESLEIEVDVSENFINRVHADQPVTAHLNAYPDWGIPAHVIAIIPTADRAKATVKVRVGFDARDERILPEMGVRVAFLDSATRSAPADPSGGGQRALLVPTSAVQANGDTGVVYVLNEDHVERRSVRLGTRTSAGQIVLSGLTAGARLATGDLEKLSDGARIRVAN
ncbi:MAG: efflux RND transporter periplasmic adaptor subunit [Gammaproteobacteria bacterium]